MNQSCMFSTGTIRVPLVTDELVTVHALVSWNHRFAIVVDSGRVHVYHVATGHRLSTKDGFAKLAGACHFIEHIDPLIAWDAKPFDFRTVQKTTGVPAAAMLYDAYHDAVAAEHSYE